METEEKIYETICDIRSLLEPEPYMDGVQKHEGGGHDQSSHGNWAKGIASELTEWSPKDKVPDAPRNAAGTTDKFWDNWEHGVDGDQFVDLYRQYAGEMLGLPVPKSEKDVGGSENYLTQRGFGASSTETVRKQTEAVLNAIANGRPQPTLYRGLIGNDEPSKALLEQFTKLEVGDTIDMPLVSTSRSLGVAQWYAADRSIGENKVILKIQEGAKGVTVNREKSYYPSDFETVISGKFEVVGTSEVTVPYWSRRAVHARTFDLRDGQTGYRIQDPNDLSWDSLDSDSPKAKARYEIIKNGANTGNFAQIETSTLKYTNDRQPSGVKDGRDITVNTWVRKEPKTFTVIEVKMIEPHVVRKGADLGVTFHNLFNDIPFIRDEEEVLKHGSHDQKTHGNWATGIGYKDSDKHPEYSPNEDGTNVEYYTSVGSWEMNGLLRTGKVPEDANSDKEEIQDMIKSLDTEIGKTSAPRDMVLFRGTSGKGTGVFDKLKEGDIYTDKGFISTTSNSEVVPEFMSTAIGGRYDSRPVEKGYVLQVSVPKGSKVLSVNRYFKKVSGRYGPSDDIRREDEHILPRGTKFRVDSIGTIDVRGLKDKLIKVSVVNDEK